MATKNHFHKHVDDDRAACGQPLGSKPFLSASTNPARVSCKRCRRALVKGVLVLDRETGATVLVKLESK